MRRVKPCQAKKKNVLLRTTGPPTVAPYMFCDSGTTSLRKKLRESRLSLRRNSHRLPWISFVPDLVTTLTIPPAPCPNSAWSLCVWTLNSWMASMIGGVAYVLTIEPWLITPSVRKKLLRLLWPFMAGYANSPIAALPKPPRFCAVLMGDAPGVSVSNWVKLRPLSGRSTTWFSFITEPSSAVELWTSAPTASTVTVSATAPISKAKSSVAVWLTTKVNGCSELVRKPSLLAVRM